MEISNYIANYRYLFRFQADPERGELLIILFILPDTDRFAVIIADIIHNLRSALDQLTVALAKMEGRGGSDTYFPTADSRAKFEAEAIVKIKKAGPTIVRLFRLLEPYQGGKLEAIWGLNKLAVLDKHRLIIPAVTIPKIASFSFRCKAGVFRVPGSAFEPQGANEFAARIPWAYSWFEDVRFYQNMNATLDICFGEVEVFKGQSVIPTMHNLIQLTERVFKLITKTYTRALERKLGLPH